MKKILLLTFSLGLIIAWASPSMASHVATAVGDTAGGVSFSRHNFGAGGSHVTAMTDTGGTISATTQICVFCHTPHHSRTDTAPLWNKGTYSVTYVSYGTTIAGEVVGDPSGPSLACLSCHDGVGTFDNIINAPGKGGVHTPGSTANVQGWFFFEGTETHPDAHNMKVMMTGPGLMGRVNIGDGAGFVSGAGGVADLSNDHPISLEYSDGNSTDGETHASLRDRSLVLSAVDLSTGTKGNDATSSGVYYLGGSAVGCFPNCWAVDGYIKGGSTDSTTSIASLLKGEGATATVECSSCHDPHYKNLTNPDIDATYTGATPHPTAVSDTSAEDVDGLFLRRVGGNSYSGVCRTCHEK